MLPRWGRLALLSLHIMLTGAWLGASALIAWLLLDATPATDLAAFLVQDVAIWSSLAVLGTSVCFALFTPWAFFRHRWLIVKWLGLVVLSLLAMFVRTPAVNALAAAADLAQDGGPWRLQALASSAFEVGALASLVALSVVKPWGKTQLPWSPPRKVIVPAVVTVVLLVAGLSIAQAAVLAGYRATAITAAVLPAGSVTCEGRARLGVEAEARLRIDGGRLVEASTTARPETHYTRLARGVGDKMLREQRIDVDAVTGATTTSRALQLAAIDALRRCVP